MKAINVVEKNFCTTRDAAKILGVSVRTAQLWVENGLLKAWKTTGGHRRVSRDSVEGLLYKRVHTQSATSLAHTDGPLKILIVEDDRLLRRLYQAVLSKWPMPLSIVVASNGVEALVKIGREQPDLLVTDLSMPEMDGFKMLRLLDSMPEVAEMDIVVVSGLQADEIAQNGGLPRRIPILSKPVPFQTLREIVNRTLARKQSRFAEAELTPETAIVGKC